MRSKIPIIVSSVFLIPGLILSFLFSKELKSFLEYQSIKNNGVSSKAKIIEILNSNIYINDVRQQNLEVSFSGQKKVFKSIDPQYLLEKKPGDEIAIKHDPDDLKKFVLEDIATSYFLLFFYGIFFLFFGLGNGLLFLFLMKRFKNYNYLQKNGIPAIAKIINIKKSSLRINNVFQKNIEVEFLNQKRILKNVNPDFLNGKNLGSDVAVKYDGRDPNNFILA